MTQEGWGRWHEWLGYAALAVVIARIAWGWVEELHGALSNVLITVVVLHVAGVVFTSFRQRENLVGAMLHGSKRPAGERDVA